MTIAFQAERYVTTTEGEWPSNAAEGSCCFTLDTHKHFCRVNGGWVELGGSGSGTGDVVGPASAVADNFVSFNGTTGKLVKDSGSAAASFAAAAHNHDSAYSALGHNHDAAYSALGHNHDAAYAALSHNHDATYAPLSHAHAAGDITSGTIATARLGGGSASSSTYLRGDQTWATPPGGGGGSGQLVAYFQGATAAAATWTNMPLAETFLFGSHRHVQKLDLTNYTQVRLVVNKQATAGAAASVIFAKYATTFQTAVGSYSAIGTSAVQVAVNVQNSVLVTNWVDLAAGAMADVFVCLAGSGGDGVLDPAFGAICLQFR